MNSESFDDSREAWIKRAVAMDFALAIYQHRLVVKTKREIDDLLQDARNAQHDLNEWRQKTDVAKHGWKMPVDSTQILKTAK